MEDFFEDLGNTLKKTAETVEKKTNDFIGMQKLRSRISACERKTERNFRDLGEIIFRRFVDGESMDGVIANICDEVLELQKELAVYRERLAAKRGLTICPACGAHVPRDAAFCMRCGAPMPKEESRAEEAAAETETTDTETSDTDAQPQEAEEKPAQDTQDGSCEAQQTQETAEETKE